MRGMGGMAACVFSDHLFLGEGVAQVNLVLAMARGHAHGAPQGEVRLAQGEALLGL